MNELIVTIPACQDHAGINSVQVKISDRCPVCGRERATVKYGTGVSYDGGKGLTVNVWENQCGHLDRYSLVLLEARWNGWNTHLPSLTYNEWRAQELNWWRVFHPMSSEPSQIVLDVLYDTYVASYKPN